MNLFDRWIDGFCRKHPRLGVPNLMMYVVLGNLLVYVMDMFSRGTFSALLTFHRGAILQGQIWRFLTFVFVPEHFSSPLFLALALYFYYSIVILDIIYFNEGR